MRKASSLSPLLLVLTLAATALILSLCRENPPAPAAGVNTPAAATNRESPTVKTDAGAPRAEPLPWPHESSDIPPDPATVFGSLPNGMRYIIHPNSEPPGKVSLRLRIAAGSLMEAEDQRGIAHFLEHMLFNGTKNFTAAEIVPRMQRLGIAFGAHANAYTSFDETVYMLDLPDMSEDTLALAFTVMRDFCDGALLEPAEIEQERGVILAEKISRDSVDYRIMEQQFNELLPGSLVSRRFPIGTEEVIKAAPRDRFVDFYTRYYTPRRTTFIVAGDVDADEMRGRIQNAFASVANPLEPGTDPDPGDIQQPEGVETAVFHDRELASTEVSIMLARPHAAKPDNVATRAGKMPLEIAHSIISRRIERISKQRGSPVASGYATDSVLFNHLELGSLGITAADGRWREVVPVLEQEFRRALQHGFTGSELAEARSALLNAYQQQVDQKTTRRSDGIATVLARRINDNKVFATPETDLEIARGILDTIDPAACHRAFRDFWEAPGHHLVLTTPEIQENAKQELAALFEESRGTPVEEPVARAIPVFDYNRFGRPGVVRSRTESAAPEITQLVLSNQVRVNLMRTGFEQGKIRMLARLGSGKLTQPADKPMLDVFAQAVFQNGGLGKHSAEDLKQILAGRNVGCTMGVEDDAFTLGGTTTPADFGLQCRLLCAALTDPGFREEALWQFQKSLPPLYQQLRHTPAGPQREMNAWLRGGDPRFATASMPQISAYTIRDARKWLEPALAKDYLELSIVGDFDPQRILPELLATFGALPARAPQPQDPAGARKLSFPAAPAAKSLTYESKIPQAAAHVVWKTSGLRGNLREFRRLNILASILGDRLRGKIREDLGSSYSPFAAADGSDAFDDFGYIVSQSVCQPGDLETLLDTMRGEADRLATAGATRDELDRALKPVLAMLEKSLRDNNYWLNTVLSRSQADPERLELARTRDADYRSISLDEINALAKRYLTEGKALQVAIRPSP